jgi:hypothetical protein
MPTARWGLGLAGATNGKLYAIGGFNGADLATVEEYDPATNAWTNCGGTPTTTHCAPMPTARHALAVVAAPNGKLYAIGGQNGATFPAAVEEYDPATNAWATRAALPTPRYGLAAVAVASGKLYAIGGFNGGPLATVEAYDPATNTWVPRAPLLQASEYPGAAAAGSGKLYALGGFGGGAALASAQEYDPAANSWAQQFPMNTARYGLGAAAAPTGKLYAIGGTPNDVTYLDRVEEFTPPGPPPPTATPTPTQTATPTRTLTPTITPTPYPRPNVAVQVAPSAGTLQTTITARDAACAQGNNQLQALQFTRLSNATVDVGSPPLATVANPTTVPLPAHPASIPLTVRRTTSGQGATVEVVVTDGCGTWPTFIGGGPSAF